MPATKKRASGRIKSNKDIEKKEKIISVSEKSKITKAKVGNFSNNKKTGTNVFLLILAAIFEEKDQSILD